MPRPKPKDVEIFNFSFLDILACTIGALTFILVLVIVSSVNQVMNDEDIKPIVEQIEKITAELEKLNDQLASVEAELAPLQQRDVILKQQIAADESEIKEANDSIATAEELLQESQRQVAEAKQSLATDVPELAKTQANLSKLQATVTAFNTAVAAMESDLAQRSSDLQQLRSDTLNRKELLEKVAQLENENKQLPETIEKKKAENLQADADTQELAKDAEDARGERPQLFARLSAVKTEADKTQEAIDQLTKQKDELADDFAEQSSTAQNAWLLFYSVVVVAIVLIGGLMYLIMRLAMLAAPLRKWQKALNNERQALRELEARVAAASKAAQDVPANAAEAVEQLREQLAQAERDRAAAVVAAQQFAQDKSQAQRQLAAEQRELSNMRSEAETAHQQARQQAKAVNFRVPLLRATKKDSILFECFNSRLARVTKPGGLDDENYKINIATSAMLTAKLGATAIVIDRKGSGSSQGELAQPTSSISRKVNDVKPSTEFVFVIVRPDGYESFRQLRDAAWQRSLEVGWQPLEEEVPIMSTEGGSGRAPGVQ